MRGWFYPCCWDILGDDCVYSESYPDDKITIKNEIVKMLEALGETVHNYIKYCFDNDFYNELYAILEFSSEFGMTRQEHDKLETES